MAAPKMKSAHEPAVAEKAITRGVRLLVTAGTTASSLPWPCGSRVRSRSIAAPKNFAALADLPGQWIDLVHGRRPPRGILLDMDSSVSPTHGEQEKSVWNGHYACTYYH